MTNCEANGQYGKDNNKDLHFHCVHCNEEMNYGEKRICSAKDKNNWKEELRNEYKKRYTGVLDDKVIESSADWLIAFISPVLHSQKEELRGKIEKIRQENVGGLGGGFFYKSVDVEDVCKKLLTLLS